MQPFNHPLLIAVKKIAPALAMGNSVIIKPSEVSGGHPLMTHIFYKIYSWLRCPFSNLLRWL